VFGAGSVEQPVIAPRQVVVAAEKHTMSACHYISVPIEEFLLWFESRLMDKYSRGTPALNDSLCCMSTILLILRALRFAACQISLQEQAADSTTDGTTEIRSCTDSMIGKIDEFCEELSPFLDDLAVEWLVIQGTDLHLLLTMYHHLLSTLQTDHSRICAQMSSDLQSLQTTLQCFKTAASGCSSVIQHLAHLKRRFLQPVNHLTDDLRSFHLSDRAKQEYIKGQAQFQTALGNFNKNQPNDNFPKEFATARAKLAAAAAELDIIIAPFVNVCKAVHKSKKKMTLDDALNASIDSEQLNRFTPLLGQPSVLEALLTEAQQESGAEALFFETLVLLAQIYTKDQSNLSITKRQLQSIENLKLQPRTFALSSSAAVCGTSAKFVSDSKKFVSDFATWQAAHTEHTKLSSGPRARQYKSALDALGDNPKSFERKVNDFQRSLAFYNRTMALGQDLQVEVAECCYEELQIRVGLDLQLQTAPTEVFYDC